MNVFNYCMESLGKNFICVWFTKISLLITFTRNVMLNYFNSAQKFFFAVTSDKFGLIAAVWTKMIKLFSYNIFNKNEYLELTWLKRDVLANLLRTIVTYSI